LRLSSRVDYSSKATLMDSRPSSTRAGDARRGAPARTCESGSRPGSRRGGPSLDGGGYRSSRLPPSSECARSIWFEGARLGPSRALRTLLQLPTLLLYLGRLQRVEVPLSDEPEGRAIREHLALRRWGLPRFRLAQGVLQIPEDFDTYLRGRSRQALRTNIRRARELGVSCHSETLAAWAREGDGLRVLAPAQRWWATRADGTIVAHALITVDRRCALLHQLDSGERYVRWLLHAEIVKSLCESGRELLITNSSDVPLLSPGSQHLQHLLGYAVARLRPRTLSREPLSEGAASLRTLASGGVPSSPAWTQSIR
jgi:hypothetical protein